MAESNKLIGAEFIPKVDGVRSDDFVSTYVNHVRLGMSQWDIWVAAGYLDASTANQSRPLERINMFMAPTFAKALSQDFARLIAQYESAFGEIHMPEPGPTPPQPTSSK